jgi:hypothetical protein
MAGRRETKKDLDIVRARVRGVILPPSSMFHVRLREPFVQIGEIVSEFPGNAEIRRLEQKHDQHEKRNNQLVEDPVLLSLASRVFDFERFGTFRRAFTNRSLNIFEIPRLARTR